MNASYVKNDGGAFACVINNDALSALRQIPDGIFNVAVTSPPYFWVRDYGYKGQIGHEDSVERYVEALVNVFTEVKRTLHPEGVFFLNIGDTYYSGNGQPHGHDPKCSSRDFARRIIRAVDQSGWNIPRKSLIGIPWKVAFALQENGWTLRSSIIWNRCNAFVEPTARDRPYRQYEFIFMFSKQRFYSFDREKLLEEDVWNIPIERSRNHNHNAYFPSELVRRCIEVGSPIGGNILDPFVGSGTTVFTAIQHKRNVVGIDMSIDYTSSIVSSLLSQDNIEITQKDFWDQIVTSTKNWPSWHGNRLNFHKHEIRK